MVSDQVIDYFFNTIDEALLNSDFDWVDKLLKYTMTDNTTPTHILLSILTITLAANSFLPTRHEFCKFCDTLFKERNEENACTYLMMGLWHE